MASAALAMEVSRGDRIRLALSRWKQAWFEKRAARGEYTACPTEASYQALTLACRRHVEARREFRRVVNSDIDAAIG